MQAKRAIKYFGDTFGVICSLAKKYRQHIKPINPDAVHPEPTNSMVDVREANTDSNMSWLLSDMLLVRQCQIVGLL